MHNIETSLDVSLPSVPSAFQIQVNDYLEKHWCRIQSIQKGVMDLTTHLPEEKELLVHKISGKLTNYRFCRQRPEDVQEFQSVIRKMVDQSEPIPVILGHGPLKNRNNCEASQVDWAEFFTFSHLALLHQTIQEFYPPGLSVTLFLDDARAHYANGIPEAWTECYIHSLRELVDQTALSQLITRVVSLKEDYASFQVMSYLDQAEAMVVGWEKDPDNRALFLRQIAHASRNQPPGILEDRGTSFLRDLDVQEENIKAAHRYRVYLQAEILAGIWSLPNVLYGRFSPHSGFWQLFTLRKGSVSQPWQGKGCIHLTPQGRMEPFLMTQRKQSQFEVLETFETQIPLKSFSWVDVVTEKF